MRGRCWLGLISSWLVIFLCLSISPTRCLLELGREPPVHLHLIASDFVRITVGNPGRFYIFRLNLTLSAIHLHRTIETESRTAEVLPDGSGSDLFYLGNSAYRLPFHYSASGESERVVTMLSTRQSSGTLGLGKNSPLWKYWREFSLTSDRLTLGAFDRYSRLDLENWPPLISYSAPPDCLVNGETSYPVDFHFNHLDLYLPHTLYRHVSEIHSFTFPARADCDFHYARLGLEDERVCEATATLLLKNQNITLVDGIPYTAIQHSHDGKIHFGRRFLQDYLLFVDIDTDQILLSQSAFSPAPSDFAALTTTVIFAFFALWLWLVLNRAFPTSELLLYGILAIEVCIYGTCLIAVFVSVFGFQWGRYPALFIQANPWLVVIFVISNVTGFSLFGLWTLLKRVRLPLRAELREATKRQNYLTIEKQVLVRILLVGSSALLSLWWLLLPERSTMGDTVLTLITSTLLCAMVSLVSLHLTLQEHSKPWMLVALLTADHFFLIFFNLLPIHSLFIGGEVVNAGLFVLAYVSVCCWFPVFILWAKIQIQMAKFYESQLHDNHHEALTEAFYFWFLPEISSAYHPL